MPPARPSAHRLQPSISRVMVRRSRSAQIRSLMQTRWPWIRTVSQIDSASSPGSSRVAGIAPYAGLDHQFEARLDRQVCVQHAGRGVEGFAIQPGHLLPQIVDAGRQRRSAAAIRAAWPPDQRRGPRRRQLHTLLGVDHAQRLHHAGGARVWCGRSSQPPANRNKVPEVVGDAAALRHAVERPLIIVKAVASRPCWC